ncbi:S66 peptidase family protein [Endozoicomonas sp. SESOKO3]|uniref:S66 family peptidase n=1 Tax=Endozoicomonas sp. SESOKO3 TaxID=2828744 RepID=UPI00214973BA|nr:S66 peptidase family protein [Endozoicomonas sp. SESOKO3]
MKYPAPLRPDSRIAITAFSSGVPKSCHPRLDRCLDDLRRQGFVVVEGECLRSNQCYVSASLESRARELTAFLLDDSIDAIMPPWGGEIAMDLLSVLDFDSIAKAKPKWLAGFSDISTLTSVITSQCDWATAHCTNLMQLHRLQQEPLTANTLAYLGSSEAFSQYPSEKYQINGESYDENPDAVFNLTESTRWKVLGGSQQGVAFSGRLLGGCLDTLCHLLGSDYLDLKCFQKRYSQDGIILFLENAEFSPTALIRALLGLKYRGTFNLVKGLLIGRNPSDEQHGQSLTYQQALSYALKGLEIPIIYDVDIGHLPPNLTLINGALADVSLIDDRGKIHQRLI